MLKSRGINRVAMLLILPLMAFAVLGGTRLSPRAAARPPAAGVLVVANLRGESLSFIDFADPDRPRTLFAAGPPHELALAGGRLYATLGRADALIEVEPAAPALLRELSLRGQPHGLSVSGGDLLVTTAEGGSVLAIDRGSFTVRAFQHVGGTPHALADQGGHIYVAQAEANTVEDLLTGRTLPTGRMPEAVAIVGAFVVVANAASGSVTVIDRESWRVLGEVAVGAEPVRVIALDGTRAVVALGADSQIAVVDLVRLRVIRREKTLERPDGLCLDSSGEYLAVISNAMDAAVLFQVKDWRIAVTVATGDGPGACAWLPKGP